MLQRNGLVNRNITERNVSVNKKNLHCISVVKGLRLSMDVPNIKDLLLKKLKVVPLFIQLMTPNGAIWSLDQKTAIKR